MNVTSERAPTAEVFACSRGAQWAQQFVPTHRAAQFNFDAPLEELKVRAPHGKIKLILIPGASDLDAFAKTQFICMSMKY